MDVGLEIFVWFRYVMGYNKFSSYLETCEMRV